MPGVFFWSPEAVRHSRGHGVGPVCFVPERCRDYVGAGATLPACTDQPTDRRTITRSDLPADFLDRLSGWLPDDEVDPFLEALAAPEDGLRLNSLRGALPDLRARLPFRLSPLPGLDEGFVLGAGSDAGRHPFHAAGLYYLQDPAAMLVAAVVDPQPGERVLDLAAAPGGKTTHLAARMQNRGLLVANDVSPARAADLTGNLERCGVRNAVALSVSVGKLVDHFGPYFDRVLVDAPCSGESMFGKSETARKDWNMSTVAGCARRQVDLFGAAVGLVRPGGRLIYSTCTFSPEENEHVVERVAGEYDLTPDTSASLPDGVEVAEGDLGYRLWPHRVAGAGHFVALLRKPDSNRRAVAPASGRSSKSTSNSKAPEPLVEFLESTMPGFDIPLDRVARHGDNLSLPPADLPELGGMRVFRAGLALGSLRKSRFEPAHALALAAGAVAGSRHVDLAADDPRVAHYLAGETIHASGDAGWLIVCVEGYALGWGKRSGAVVKNHYPKGLRRRG